MTTDPDRNAARSGNEKRRMKSAARLYAVQALFQMEHSGQTVERVMAEFENHRFGAIYEGVEMMEGDLRHFRAVMQEAVNWQASIDQLTDRALVAKWPIARIDPTLRALFRAAGAEITQLDTPPASPSPNMWISPRRSFPMARRRSSSTPSSITWRMRQNRADSDSPLAPEGKTADIEGEHAKAFLCPNSCASTSPMC